MIANILLNDLSIRADDVEVTNNSLFDLRSCLDIIPIADVRIADVGLNAEGIVTADLHYVVLLGSRLEHNHCPFFNYIVISEDYFEMLVFLLADDGTGRIDDAALTEDHVANDLIES